MSNLINNFDFSEDSALFSQWQAAGTGKSYFVSGPVFRMEVVGKQDEMVGCHKDMRNILDETSDRRWEIGSIERHVFYERAKNAYAVVCTAGERRPYKCFIFIKRVIGPDGEVI